MVKSIKNTLNDMDGIGLGLGCYIHINKKFINGNKPHLVKTKKYSYKYMGLDSENKFYLYKRIK